MARLKSSSNHLWHSRTSVRPAPINNKSIGTHSGRRPIPIGLAATAKTSGNLNSNPKSQPQSMVSTTHQARRASDHHHRPIGSYKVDLGQIQNPPADDIQPRTSSSPVALPDESRSSTMADVFNITDPSTNIPGGSAPPLRQPAAHPKSRP
ncbi:hypothetical protein ACLOJK_027062 [Asimina triloba]